jgi:four helix bundle protein
MSGKGLENLRVHQMARELVRSVYRDIVPKLPEDEKWGLISQIKRAVLSIPANIAEGYGRFYFQENIRFCYNARGSLDELTSHLMIAMDLKFLSRNDLIPVEGQISDLRKALNGYIRFLKTKKENYSVDSDRRISEKHNSREIYI